jgi:hypothetical protein
VRKFYFAWTLSGTTPVEADGLDEAQTIFDAMPLSETVKDATTLFNQKEVTEEIVMRRTVRAGR